MDKWVWSESGSTIMPRNGGQMFQQRPTSYAHQFPGGGGGWWNQFPEPDNHGYQQRPYDNGHRGYDDRDIETLDANFRRTKIDNSRHVHSLDRARNSDVNHFSNRDYPNIAIPRVQQAKPRRQNNDRGRELDELDDIYNFDRGHVRHNRPTDVRSDPPPFGESIEERSRDFAHENGRHGRYPDVLSDTREDRRHDMRDFYDSRKRVEDDRRQAAYLRQRERERDLDIQDMQRNAIRDRREKSRDYHETKPLPREPEFSAPRENFKNYREAVAADRRARDYQMRQMRGPSDYPSRNDRSTEPHEFGRRMRSPRRDFSPPPPAPQRPLSPPRGRQRRDNREFSPHAQRYPREMSPHAQHPAQRYQLEMPPRREEYWKPENRERRGRSPQRQDRKGAKNGIFGGKGKMLAKVGKFAYKGAKAGYNMADGGGGDFDFGGGDFGGGDFGGGDFGGGDFGGGDFGGGF